MVKAYENLSDHTQRTIQDLKALHSGIATFERSVECISDARPIDPAEIKPPRAHPVVRTADGTGQKAIFVNPHFTIDIENLEIEENLILNHLYEVATQPENIYRHQWRQGDVLVWDNRRTMHYAVRDYTEIRTAKVAPLHPPVGKDLFKHKRGFIIVRL